MPKLILLLSAVFIVMPCVAAKSKTIRPERPIKKIKTLWIEQKLDNFNGSETKIWRMRYLENGQFYKAGGPLFVHIGGEWSISRADINGRTLIYQLAKEHNGYLFYTEHRFYGRSKPLTLMTSEHLSYLNVQQALADLANFISTIKKLYDGMDNSKVILIGCSYGSLVTWFKKLYPDMVTAGWASSAPLLAKVDYFENQLLVQQSLQHIGGNACYNRIKNGFAELETMLANQREAEVKALLNVCSSFNASRDLDVSTLFFNINSIFSNLVQLHRYNEIQEGCDRILKGSSDLIGLANYIVDKFYSKASCIELSYNLYLEIFTNPMFQRETARPWLYQQCNEFGWFRTSSSRNQTFASRPSLDYFTTLCADAFGSKFTSEYIEKKVLETNKMFGGLEADVQNIYWTQGELDPWRVFGMLFGDQAAFIPSASHCSDMGSLTRWDSPGLRAAKRKTVALVRKWLAK